MNLALVLFVVSSLAALPGISDAAGKSSPSAFGSSGYLKQDPLFKYRTDVFDKDGRPKGYLKPDPLFEDRTDYYRYSK